MHPFVPDRSVRSPRLRAIVGGLTFVTLAACAPSVPSVPEHTRSVTAALEPFSVARELAARLRQGELPAGVDRVAVELLDAARDESGQPRAFEARRAAADLLALRHSVGRDPRDLHRALDLYDTLAASAPASPTGCSALRAAGDLAVRASDTAGARTRYLAYERRCPGASELAHVHAALAALDPVVATAEGDSRRAHGPPTPAGTSRHIRRVVIDPGHGGNDPGARGPGGLAESAVTLDLARRLADHLAESMGIDVVLTRDSDVYVPLEDRARRANDAGADLFISVHCNASDNPESRGVSTYVLDTASDRVAARVAARENGEVDRDPLGDPEVLRILASLRLLGQGSRSFHLAEKIQGQILGALGLRYGDGQDLGIHPARFHVLVGARMPAVLVEVSFVSNPVEEQRLRQSAYRDVLARAITRAVQDQENAWER